MSGFAHELEREAITRTDIPVFRVGDSVDVHVKIREGNKERIQLFSGVVIARKHQGLRETFTVRRPQVGVERVFPLHSPKVEKIEVTRRGRVRRAKLYYLRDRVGKETRIKEDLRRDRKTVLDQVRNAAPKKAEPAPAQPEEPTDAETETAGEE